MITEEEKRGIALQWEHNKREFEAKWETLGGVANILKARSNAISALISESVNDLKKLLPRKVPIYNIDKGRSERVKINGKYPEGDFDLEKGENLSDNDYSD